MLLCEGRLRNGIDVVWQLAEVHQEFRQVCKGKETRYKLWSILTITQQVWNLWLCAVHYYSEIVNVHIMMQWRAFLSSCTNKAF